MKRFLRGLLALIIIALLAVAVGTFLPRPLFPAARTGTASEDSRRILVLSGPIHTDIAIRLDDESRAAFGFLEEAGMLVHHPDARWLIFGWGGRAFYLETPTWSQLKPMPLLRALTIDRSVMHVDLAGAIDEQGSFATVFDLTPRRHADLLAFIAASFARPAETVAVIPGAGYSDIDRFFEAEGSFNALIGCNTWTARALRAAGLRTGQWNPLPQTLTLSLYLFNGRS